MDEATKCRRGTQSYAEEPRYEKEHCTRPHLRPGLKTGKTKLWDGSQGRGFRCRENACDGLEGVSGEQVMVCPEIQQ